VLANKLQRKVFIFDEEVAIIFGRIFEAKI
jgi:hypothetical protein